MAFVKLFQLFSCIFLLMAILDSQFSNAHPSPFEFLKNLQGTQKGDKVQGLRDLKLYLKNFGYLTYKPHSQVQNFRPEDDDDNDNDDDHFDDTLESAIKTYQLNYHLKATGTLDAATVLSMLMPRCGVSDIINGRSRMRAAARKTMQQHHHANSLFHTVSHYSFFNGLPKWPANKTNLTYKFDEGTPINATSAIARAFNRWASVTQFTFVQIQENNNNNSTNDTTSSVADIRIGFHSRDHGDGFPFDGPYGVLAHASPPTSGSFHLDADEPWSIGPVPGRIDLETVALHEIGHLLGLQHSSVKDAIMFPSVSDGMTKDLHGDDVEGIKILYNDV